MGLFGKIKNILFEEEEIEAPEKEKKVVKEKSVPAYEEPKKEIKNELKEEIREERIEKAKQLMDEDEFENTGLFEKEPSFNFPDFDEDEFENTLPKFKEKVEEPKEVRIYDDYKPEVKSTYKEERKRETIYKKPEVKNFSKPISLFNGTKKEKEETIKKFTPSPIISPVYGILDKDYHPSQIQSRDDNLSIKRNSKLDVDSVRKKAFEPKEKEEKEEIKANRVFEEDVEEAKAPKLKKSLDELLEDSAEETVVVDEKLNVEKNIKEIEDELDKIDDELVLDEKPKEKEEDDTLEQDLFELIDSMYEDKKEDD